MQTLPSSLAIAIWVTGVSWALAALTYFLDAASEWVLPLFALGALTGTAEWIVRRKRN